MTAQGDLDDLIERHHEALGRFIDGDPEPLKAIYSRGDDVTLANPFGPPARGWHEVAETLERAAAHYEGGRLREFETLAKCVTPELAYTLEMERFEAKLSGAGQIRPVTLRVTTVFRPEDGAWRVVHRHADPISAVRPPESVVEVPA
jgi:ketosteroid isomerase-like protein